MKFIEKISSTVFLLEVFPISHLAYFLNGKLEVFFFNKIIDFVTWDSMVLLQIPTVPTPTSPAPMGAVSQLPGFVTETMIVEMDLMNLTVVCILTLW